MTLLFLEECDLSLRAVLDIINRFYSGGRITWEKSLLFPLVSGSLPVVPFAPVSAVSKFKYLGVVVQRDLITYIWDNLLPPFAISSE